jgi:hypothetical protein
MFVRDGSQTAGHFHAMIFLHTVVINAASTGRSWCGEFESSAIDKSARLLSLSNGDEKQSLQQDAYSNMTEGGVAKSRWKEN